MQRYCLWKMNLTVSKFRNSLIKKDLDSGIIFDTSLFSNNKGDHIISLYCNMVINELFSDKQLIRVPTHQLPTDDELKAVRKASLKIVCGTNIISPNYESWSLWKMPENLLGYSNIITFGVGWGYYSDRISRRSSDVYRQILSTTGLHSVRDSYTEEKMNQMGIHNVVNTGCPTMWKLTPEFCTTIPPQKADNVITALTDYSRDCEADSYLIETLSSNYEKVYVWLQGSNDYDYLKQLKQFDNIETISGGEDSFTDFLRSGVKLDYIGTRLHAGIHALNCGIRSMIIAIDNRALEISKDTALPVIPRHQLKELLLSAINEKRPTVINLPWENINRWKSQFSEKD